MAYTKEQIEAINKAREENIAKGLSPYAGAGATSYSISQGLSPKGSTTEIDFSKAPSFGVDNSDIMAWISGTLKQGGATEAQINQALQGFKPTTETSKTALSYLTALAGKRPEAPSVIEQQKTAREEVFKMFGMTPEVFQQQQALIGTLTDYQKQIADLEIKKQEELMGVERTMVGRGTAALMGEKGIIERGYNSKIAATSAKAGVVAYQYQLQQGQIEQANAMVDKIVQLQIYDYEQKVKDFEWTYNTYKDVITMWSKEEQQELDNQFRQTEADRDEAYRQASLELERYRAYKPTEYAPPTSYREWELAGGKEGTGKSYAEWISELEPTLENIKTKTKSIFQQYQGTGYSRKQIENQWKTDNNTTTIPPLIKDALDELFGKPTKKWWQFWK